MPSSSLIPESWWWITLEASRQQKSCKRSARKETFKLPAFDFRGAKKLFEIPSLILASCFEMQCSAGADEDLYTWFSLAFALNDSKPFNANGNKYRKQELSLGISSTYLHKRFWWLYYSGKISPQRFIRPLETLEAPRGAGCKLSDPLIRWWGQGPKEKSLRGL